MGDWIRIRINGSPFEVEEGVSVAAAIFRSGRLGFRKSVAGEPRAPLCGMGVCFECRAVVDGEAHQRTCMILCREGMEVEVDG